METIEIDKNRKLNPGDRVLMYFNAPGPLWIKATECAIVETALERREDFKILSIDYMQPEKVIFEVEIQKTNPVIVTVAIIAAAIIGVAGLFLAAGWMFEKAELVVETPAVKAFSIGVLIIAGIALLSLFKGKINVVRS